MLEGLEISEIKLSMLNEELRIDAEYFSKQNISGIKRLSDFGTIKINDIAEVTDGIHTSIDYDENSRINLISAGSPKENVFDLSRNVFISEKAHKANPRTALRKNDVIISTVGTIGNCAVVDESILPANCDRHVGIIRIKKDYSPYVLSTFLLSKYGRLQTMRESTGNVQLNLFIYKLKELLIPAFSKDFQSKIETLVKSAHAKLEKSKSLYAQAENLLLCELGMSGENLSEFSKPCGGANVSIKRFSDVFQSGRLDSEYYQKKYDLIEEKISHLETLKISETGKLKDKNFSPEENAEYKYIELADIGNQGEISSCTLAKGSELPTRARRIVHKGDVLVSSIEGSLQSCAIVPSEFDGALCSTGFYVIEPETMNAETLLILLKSENIQLLLKKGCSGTILTNISKEEFLKNRIPFLPPEIQSKIASLVQSSFVCRAESRQLLQNAKTLVEQEIEKQGEEIDEKKVAQINAVYDKVSEKEQISMSRSSMRSMWEAVKDDTW